MSSTTNIAERTATQAWEHLSSAMTTAGNAADRAASRAGKARRRGGRKAHEPAGRASRRADEAWARANAAAAALAGRKPRLPWGLIAAAGLTGVAVGWAVASYARFELYRQAAAEEHELAETAVVVTP